jgi:hypothetical protein
MGLPLGIPAPAGVSQQGMKCWLGSVSMDAARRLTAWGKIRGAERRDKLGLGGGRGRSPSAVVLRGLVGPAVEVGEVGPGRGMRLCANSVREVSKHIRILFDGWDASGALRVLLPREHCAGRPYPTGGPTGGPDSLGTMG